MEPYQPGDYEEVREGPPPWAPQEAASDEITEILPPARDEDLRVRVTVEDSAGNALWWFYPVTRVRLGDHVRIEFDLKFDLSP